MTQEVNEISLQELESNSSEKSQSLSPRNIDLVGHMEVQVEVCIGTANISLNRLFSLKADEVLDLNEDINAPVSVIVDGKCIAYGNLVAVDDHFGVQITEVSR